MRNALLFALLVSTGAFLAASAPPAPAPGPPLPEGVVIERVVCADAPSQSYALLLPKGFAGHRGPWPILYLFDARARGAFAARLFAPSAAERGFVVASSNNTTSDGPMDPNVTAFRALWRDTHARFAIDPRRVYAGGFSGGARIATLMASTAPGTIAGVVGCGAGFHREVRAKPPFVFFGAVGNRDFNFDEMRELDETLKGLGASRHVEVFDGDHGWPPPDVCADALDWLDLQAAKSGTRPADQAVPDRLWTRFSGRAAAFERDGRLLAAIREYGRAADDFRGLRDVSPLEQARDRLVGTAAGKRALREESARIERDRDYREHTAEVWGEIRTGESLPAARILQELDVSGLQARAASDPGSEESLSAERLLSEIYVQTGFYLPRGYREEKNWARAILCLSVATQIRPKSPGAWYAMAAVEALSGHGSRAIEDLEQAAARGFSDAEDLDRDPDFASLRGTERYRVLLDRLRAARPAAPRG